MKKTLVHARSSLLAALAANLSGLSLKKNPELPSPRPLSSRLAVAQSPSAFSRLAASPTRFPVGQWAAVARPVQRGSDQRAAAPLCVRACAPAGCSPGVLPPRWARTAAPPCPSKLHLAVSLTNLSGDHDLQVPQLSTQAWIRSLNFSIVSDWRAWHLDGQAAGFTIEYANNLTFATVKGGGHTAPEYQPEECFAMAQRRLANEPL